MIIFDELPDFESIHAIAMEIEKCNARQLDSLYDFLRTMKTKATLTTVTIQRVGAPHLPVQYVVTKIRGQLELKTDVPGKPVRRIQVEDTINAAEAESLCRTYDVTVTWRSE